MSAVDDTDFFAPPPAGEPPIPQAAEDGGFTLLGEAEAPSPAAAFVGDVQDTTDDDPMGFAAAPPTDGDDDIMVGFATAPSNGGVGETEDNGGDAGDMLGFAAAPPEPTDDGESAPIILGAPPPAEDDAFGAAGVDDSPIEESTEPKGPSAMQKFNAEFQELLNKRKEEEEAVKAETMAAAQKYMDEFKANREEKRDARMAKNREDEQAKLESIEADLENDNSWQRVSKMVDLTQDSADDNEDTKQMRDLFIKLKNEEGLAAKVGA